MSRKQLSFEFFPTRTPEGRAKQVITRKQLSQFNPAFFFVYFGRRRQHTRWHNASD